VQYEIVDGSVITLQISDLQGRVIKTVNKGYQPDGEYTGTIETTDLAPGIYILRLKTDNSFVSSKIIKLR
jgi:hypothetical protein